MAAGIIRNNPEALRGNDASALRAGTIPSEPAMTRMPTTCLFLDIGGVLLTDGWDHRARQLAAIRFKLDWAETEDRHRLMFAAYEEGKLTLDEYLSRVIFHRERAFTRDEFRDFMFAQSKPFPEMIDMIVRLKRRHGLKIAVVSNEARELNAHRIETFGLGAFVDFFVSSCFVHLRKPDADMFRIALDVAQVPAAQVVYIENTAMFVDVAADLGIRGILHTDYAATRAQLVALGLEDDDLGPRVNPVGAGSDR
jgi:putative hydrolase of the HAD superfamily